MKRSFLPAISIALVAPLATSAIAQVEMRGGMFLEDRVVGVSAAGVVVERDGDARSIGWHEIKRVGGDFEAASRDYSRLSEDLWRASTRLARGDIALAAPILERLWSDAIANERDPQTLTGVRLIGPTGLEIARGVASVRIAQGRLPEAVEPWATSIALAGDQNVDPLTLLDPRLAPIFVQSVATERLASAELTNVIQRDPLARALFELYRSSAATASGIEEASGASSTEVRDHPAVRLVADIVDAQRIGAPDRTAAIQRLRTVVDASPNDWREAWARTALGIATVIEREGRDRLAGALDLLHVPARFGESQPALAPIALAWAIVALESEGDSEHAMTLRGELESRFPESPAIGWLARRIADGGAS